jgi:hypothetical protein
MTREARRLAVLALALALATCSPREEAAELPEQGAAAEEGTVAEEEQGAAAESATAAPAVETAAGPASVAPATPEERPMPRNWMVLEFARAVEDADLEWLEENGFRVDTVMTETQVRGWLEDPAGGATITNDARIARVQAQMR